MDWKKGGVILSLSLVFLLIGILSVNAAQQLLQDDESCTKDNQCQSGFCDVDICAQSPVETTDSVPPDLNGAGETQSTSPADSAGSNSNDAYCQSLVQSVSDSSIAQGMCNNNPKCTWKNFKCVGKETQSQLPTERSTLVQVEEGEQPEPEKTSQPVIIPPSNLKASLSNNNVILTWKPATVTTTSGIGSAGAAVLENQITGNAGFFDSIANFFRNLFGIGTRGTLTQSQLTYDVWRKEGSGAYNVLEQSVLCSVSRNTCSYTDTTAQQGKTYYYKVGVRPSTEVFSSTSVKFSNEASINIPAAAQLPVDQRLCTQLTESECATQSSRCELAQGPTSVMICRDKTTTQPACGSITDIYLCSDNDDRCTWDITTNNCVDKTTEQHSGQPASLGVNVAPNVAVGGRVTATISGGTPTYRVAPLLGYGSICRIVVPTPNADGTAFVGGTTFTIEGLADGSCMIRVTDNASPARFKDVSISVGSEQVIPVEQRVCSQLTESECATQSSRCEWVQGPTSAMLCRDKVVTTLEICDNNVDDDGDHVIDKLDKDCTGSYVNIASIVPPTRDALVGTDVDFVCKVTLGGQTTDYNNALQYCVDGKIAETNCNTKSLLSNGVLFENCNVGNSAKANQTITCFIDSACNAPPNSALGNATLTASFNVVDVDFCSEGVKGDGLDIRNFDIDKSKYKIGDDIEIDVKVKSLLETRDVNVEVILYDLTDRDVVVDNEQSAEIKRSSTEDFAFKLAIPGSVDEDNKYRVYVKVSEDRNEDEQCKLDSKSLKIEGTGCVDKDKDGSCTPADCNDSNANVYPTAAEICSDAIDNNCNGLVDSQDYDCSAACVTGQTRSCGVNVGECKGGTETCTNGRWSGQCQGALSAKTEVCNDGRDNDCDGLTDCNDSDCSGNVLCVSGQIVDSDFDGLEDEWERQFFGGLASGPEDDLDGDGYSNIKEFLGGSDPTDKNSKPGSSIWIFVLILIIVIALIAFAIYYLYFSKPKSPKLGAYNFKVSGGSARNNRKLEEYIKSSLRKGFTKTQVRNALRAKGWTDEEVTNAFDKF